MINKSIVLIEYYTIQYLYFPDKLNFYYKNDKNILTSHLYTYLYNTASTMKSLSGKKFKFYILHYNKQAHST